MIRPNMKYQFSKRYSQKPRNGMTKYLLVQNGTAKHQFDQEMVWPNKNLSKMVRPNINLTKKRYGQISIYPKWYGQTSIWPRMIWPNKNFAQNGMTKNQFNQEMIFSQTSPKHQRHQKSPRIPTIVHRQPITHDNLWSPQFRRRGSLDKDRYVTPIT